MICIEEKGSGIRRRIEREIWIVGNRNGSVITPHRHKAQGVGDGVRVWSLGKLDGYPEARLITLAEFEEALGFADTDPELCAEEALEIIMGGIV